MRDCKRDPTTPACSCGCLQPQTRTTWGARTCPARCDPTAAPRARGESRDGPRPLLLHPLPRPPGPHPPARAAGTVPGLRAASLPAAHHGSAPPRSGAAPRRPLPAPPSPLEASPQAPALRSGAPSGCWRRPRCPEAPYPPRERSASRISARRAAGLLVGVERVDDEVFVSMAGDADQGEGAAARERGPPARAILGYGRAGAVPMDPTPLRPHPLPDQHPGPGGPASAERVGTGQRGRGGAGRGWAGLGMGQGASKRRLKQAFGAKRALK